MATSREIIAEYQKIEWSRLLRNELGEAGQLTEAKPVFDRLKKTFDGILNNQITPSLPISAKQQIENALSSLTYFLFHTVLGFSDVSTRNGIILEIRAKEWEIMNLLGNTLAYFSANEEKLNIDESKTILEKIKNDFQKETNDILSLKEDIPVLFAKLESSIKLADELESNSNIINTAISRANEWIKKNNEAVELILKSNSTDARKKANEHVTFKLDFVDIWLSKYLPFLKNIKQPSFKGSFPWLIISVFSGTMVMIIIIYFLSLGQELTIGSAILKISVVLVPSYFTVFCIQQYLSHRKLYEFYSFKDISLQNMVDLRQQLTADPTGQQLILKKSLEVIFSEPTLKDDLKYDKQLVLQLVEMLKK